MSTTQKPKLHTNTATNTHTIVDTPDSTTANRLCTLFSDADSGRRNLRGGFAVTAVSLAIILAVFHLYVAVVADVSELMRNALHFAGFSLLCAMSYPLSTTWVEKTPILLLDIAFGIIVAVSAVYLVLAEDAINQRGVKLSTTDWIAAIVVIVGAIELTRRATGWVIPSLIIIALSYVTWLGPEVPGVFSFKGLSTEMVLFRSIYGDDAIFGTIAKISSTYVFLFIGLSR